MNFETAHLYNPIGMIKFLFGILYKIKLLFSKYHVILFSHIGL